MIEFHSIKYSKTHSFSLYKNPHPTNNPTTSISLELSFLSIAMNQTKVHSSSTHGNGNVPFSWENQPGISKVKHNQDYYYCPNKELGHLIKLRLPPYLLDSPVSSPGQKHQYPHPQQELQNIPLPPCPFQSLTITTRSSSRKGSGALRSKQDDDPFLAAFKECTKSTTTVGQRMNKLCKNKKNGGSDEHHEENQSRFGMGFMSSCKKSCGVREDSLISRSQHHQLSVAAAAPVFRENSWRQQTGRKHV